MKSSSHSSEGGSYEGSPNSSHEPSPGQLDESRRNRARPGTLDNDNDVNDDVNTLRAMGYVQELSRSLSGFSNLAISLSIICILAGGITSFPLGFSAAGGAAIGIGWPLVCLFSLIVASTMGQIASAFPTAGGLYHWASILGGRGWGWTTAWFNLLGLITVLAAINVGAYQFFIQAFDLKKHDWFSSVWSQPTAICAITFSQAVFNHRGIRLTARLTDFSGYWIMAVSGLLTIGLFCWAPEYELSRLWSIVNNTGIAAADLSVWPAQSSLAVVFCLSLLLPAYTITGFDASAHVSEETIAASRNVPTGIVRSVIVSGAAGWFMLIAVVLAIPDMAEAAAQGSAVFFWMMQRTVPLAPRYLLFAGIVVAQYLCGLATVTSASRMAFAFARDGGLPYRFRKISPAFQTPANAVWGVAIAAVLFTLYADVYSTITVVCTIFLYVSYVLPAALGCWAYGRTWTTMGPWTLGIWFRPFAVVSVLGCVVLIAIGMHPPNDKAGTVLAGFLGLLAVGWHGGAKSRFPGPPIVNPS